MHDTQSFIKSYGIRELSIYARWLKYNKLQEIGKDYLTVSDEELKEIEKYIENSLIDFSTKHFADFNYTKNYKDIDIAIENTRDRKLLIPIKIPITRTEYEKLLEIDNDEYRRIIFVMLVESKYFKLNNVSIIDEEINKNTMFFVSMPYKDVMKAAKVKSSKEKQKESMYYLFQNGFFGRTAIKDLFYVKIVDINKNPEDVVEWIFDYDHLDLHYERIFTGRSISECKYCGCLFRQNKNKTAKYCFKHRKYIHKEYSKVRVCKMCGNCFDATNRTKRELCDVCYKEYRYKIKHKNKVVV